MSNRWRENAWVESHFNLIFLNPFSSTLLTAYTGQTIILRLPRDLTIKDFDWLSMWCTAVDANFGHVIMPKNDLDEIPPALGQNDDMVRSCIT